MDCLRGTGIKACTPISSPGGWLTKLDLAYNIATSQPNKFSLFKLFADSVYPTLNGIGGLQIFLFSCHEPTFFFSVNVPFLV
jgi:hypothetical protein